ncbi:MAG: AMP-binding protein [Bacteroidales bacterium]|nr:AMP-binding protein [Lentimicrobiaceae bacterium]MDD5695180.1 AMP-binding protein [Bacteroidales bacterium]
MSHYDPDQNPFTPGSHQSISGSQACTVGEILIRGENVMRGYYKNETATAKILDAEGWLHSGDLGLMDQDGFLFIKGRSDNMIPGSGGKNIYPEELEARLDNKYAVGESLVVERDSKLVALIYPDADAAAASNLSGQALQDLYRQYIKEINDAVPSYMHITRFEIQSEEFTKTPKRNIRRHLYS